MVKCQLCYKEAELQNSHIYPKFIGKWMKSNGGGRFRYGENMDKPEQDLPKQKMLCIECEMLFSKWEKQFSEEMFKPLMNDDIHNFEYRDWFFKFLVSVLWRVLIVSLSRPITKNNQKMKNDLIEAEKEWQLFLNGEIETTQFDNIQVFLVSEVVKDNLDDIVNLNNYLMRSSDLDICSSDDKCLIYLKLGRFIIVCQVVGKMDIGVKIVNGIGILKETTSKVNNEFGNYLFNRIKEFDELAVSKNQQDKIEKRFRKNIDKIRGSNLEKTMRKDFERRSRR